MGRRLLVAAVVITCLAIAPSAISSPTLSCSFNGPTYPKLSRHSLPGNYYVVFIRRRLTCDEAKTVALRATNKPNPGAFRPFTLPGGWSCVSMSPPVARRTVAGQCTKPGPGALVNWSPACDPDDSRPCTSLRRTG
jgi:hypothetical protein